MRRRFLYVFGRVHVRCNAVGLRKLLLVVDIDLGECDLVRAGQLGCERIISGRNGFAWSAPVGVDY